MTKEEIKPELKKHIIKYLNLLDLTPESIKDDQPLFGEGGLGLDSIDSIEAGFASNRKSAMLR